MFKHVYDDHVFGPPSTPIMNCLWGSNEGTGPGCQSKRPRLSLLTHLQVSNIFSSLDQSVLSLLENLSPGGN